MAPPRINDWNRFEEWVNGISELAALIEKSGISPIFAPEEGNVSL